MSYIVSHITKIFLVGLILTTVLCCNNKKGSFSLDGITSNLKDGTVLFLIDGITKKRIDSAVIKQNKFHFKTTLGDTVLNVILESSDKSLKKDFWVENKPISFNASKRSFESALISGSTAEKKYNKLYEVIDTLSRKERNEKLIEFVKRNSNNILGVIILNEWYISLKKEITKSLFNNFSESNKKSFYAKEVLEYLMLNKNPKIGDSIIDFELPNRYGKTVRLDDFKEKWVLLEFWASNCAPCRKDNKKLRLLYDNYKSLGFEILQVSLDDRKENWTKAIEEDSISWTNISDLAGWKSKPALIYGVKALPTNFLVNPEGKIIAKDIRVKDLEVQIRSKL